MEKHKSSVRYPPEVRARAVRMVLEHAGEHGSQWEAIVGWQRGSVPGMQRRPLKKLEPDAPGLLRILESWRDKAARVGRRITRIALAYKAGREGFWLARWLRALQTGMGARFLFS